MLSAGRKRSGFPKIKIERNKAAWFGMADLNYIFISSARHLLTGNHRDIVADVAQDINAAAAKVLVEFQFHAGEIIGMDT
jgi:hypothetical protein